MPWGRRCQRSIRGRGKREEGRGTTHHSGEKLPPGPCRLYKEHIRVRTKPMRGESNRSRCSLFTVYLYGEQLGHLELQLAALVSELANLLEQDPDLLRECFAGNTARATPASAPTPGRRAFARPRGCRLT